MGTSYVNIGKSGFWMRDGVLELWLRLLALHLPEPCDKDSSQAREITYEIRNLWLLNSKGWFNGFVTSDLDRYAIDDPGKSIILAAIKSLRIWLDKVPGKLDKSTLNLLGWDGVEYIEDFETSRLIHVAEAFRDLIEGGITSGNHDCAFMPGSKPGGPLPSEGTQ